MWRAKMDAMIKWRKQKMVDRKCGPIERLTHCWRLFSNSSMSRPPLCECMASSSGTSDSDDPAQRYSGVYTIWELCRVALSSHFALDVTCP